MPTKKQLEEKIKVLELQLQQKRELLTSLVDEIWELIKERVTEIAQEEADAVVNDLSISR